MFISYFEILVTMQMFLSFIKGLIIITVYQTDYVCNNVVSFFFRSRHSDRLSRTRDMLSEVGVSVLSAAITTVGAAAMLMFAQITFFVKFGSFIFLTISFSIIFSLVLFTTCIALFGPQNQTGSMEPLYNKIQPLVDSICDSLRSQPDEESRRDCTNKF